MLEGRDRLLPSLASLAFPPQFPPVCRGSDRVIWGLRLMMHVKSQSGCMSSAHLLPISHREGEKCLQLLEGKAVQS